MTSDLRSLVDTLARAQAKSPQQVECFHAGVEAIIRLISEMGVEATLLPEIREENERLRQTLRQIQDAHSEIRALMTPTHIDDRARGTLALTGLLLDLYRARLETDSTGRRHSIGLSDDVQKQVVTAVSYSVWACLNPGVARPEEK